MMSRIGSFCRSTGPSLTLACLAVSAGSVALGQARFDPYNADSSAYQQYVTPTYPTNLALPGQARAAGELDRQATYGTRVSSTPYERFMQDGFDDIFANPGTRSRSGPGVPYYQSTRETKPAALTKAAEADREFYAIRKERDRRYFEAIREKDPAKRAKLLRNINAPITAADLPSDELDPSSAPGLRSRDPLSRPKGRMPMAGEPLTPLNSSGHVGSSLLDPLADPLTRGTSRSPSPSPRGRLNASPMRRPKLPSETADRARKPSTTAPSDASKPVGRDRKPSGTAAPDASKGNASSSNN